MKKIIISGFPGIGKSFASTSFGFHDSDSSLFSWESPGVRSLDFPRNYMDHIQGLSGVVMVSSHINVRNALAERGFDFWLVYPHLSCKGEYLERFKRRDDSDYFINMLSDNWESWIQAMDCEGQSSTKIRLGSGMYLSDIVSANLAEKHRR